MIRVCLYSVDVPYDGLSWLVFEIGDGRMTDGPTDVDNHGACLAVNNGV